MYIIIIISYYYSFSNAKFNKLGTTQTPLFYYDVITKLKN